MIAVAAQYASAEIRVLAVVSSAGFTPGVPFVGSLASIGLTGLTGIQGIQSAAGYPLPYQLAGVTVTVDGTLAPILAVADLGVYQQINIQVPAYRYQSPQTIVVSQSGQVGQLDVDFYSSHAVGAGAWGVFFEDAAGYGAFQHADYSLVTHDHPAQPGEVIMAYCSNLAAYADVMDAPLIGDPAQADPLPWLSPTRSVLTSFAIPKVNTKPAEVFYAGLSPGSVGLFQMNFRVPDDTPDGDATLNATTDNSSCYGAGAFCPPLKISRAVKVPVRR
ncbi:MAG: hypothetical protein LLG20_20190 [Acidobacteriales bacterium]|nr:hypothetical protein [Terriglobales bacterium]